MIMKSRIAFCFACFLALNTAVWAQETDQKDKSEKIDASPSIEEQMAKLVALGPGVHNVKKDKKGRILSCIVVGQSRISTALGKSKGLEVARDKAGLACSAEFVKWLKEDVKIFQSTDDETIILLTGEEGGENESILESAKAVEKSTKKIESVSTGLIRGLLILHKEVDSADKTYTLVKGWKAETADAAKKIDDKSPKDSIKSASKKKQDKNIEDEAVTSKAADAFLLNPK